MLIGIDDTDSLEGGCTTYIGAMLFRELHGNAFPRLVRLNPNIPYKTRGNGAILLDVEGDEETPEKVLSTVRRYSQLNDRHTNPGVAFLKEPGKKSINHLNKFYKTALSELVEISDAEKFAEKSGAEIHKFKNGRGVIGALAAIGSVLDDKTYELIAYRKEKNFSKPRKINASSVIEMDRKTYPQTFDNIDPETSQVLITPRGYDPILCGIRGESPGIVSEAWEILHPDEKTDFTQIFETNQGTDCHLRRKKISETKPYDSVIVGGFVTCTPETIEGGHVLFKLSDGSGEMACAAYEPTGSFRKVVRELVPGDSVEVSGGIGKYQSTVNMEKLNIKKLADTFRLEKPKCCGKTMTSAGKDKGFKCRACGKRTTMAKTVMMQRNITAGLYEVPPRARRHLSKPIVRG